MSLAQPGPERPSILTILSIVTGLPIALWSYKCLMMIFFQRKIIYMPYIPLGARQEELTTHVPPSLLQGIDCEQVSVQSEKGVTLSGILIQPANSKREDPDTLLVYFQGNAGNPLHRLPVFQALLNSLYKRPPPTPLLSRPSPPSSPRPPRHAILSIAPRSYWKSTPRTSTQRGITLDYLYAVRHALNRFPHSSIIIYGHSLGAAVAVCLLSLLHSRDDVGFRPSHPWSRPKFPLALTHDPRLDRIQGLILENPFSSIPEMVRALYPSKWIPYRYLAPFVWDKWDAGAALRSCSTAVRRHNETSSSISPAASVSVLARLARNTLVLQSEHDEIVPCQMGEEMYALAQAVPRIVVDSRYTAVGGEEQGQMGRFVVVPGALHDTAWTKAIWTKEMKTYVERVGRLKPH
ncbi:hypothetical protein AX17_005503 [Amanita inopinata Kibby_2008]|nr:hypothetical protein AX17_005503 [Amanita inopinata Kibby_2008]